MAGAGALRNLDAVSISSASGGYFIKEWNFLLARKIKLGTEYLFQIPILMILKRLSVLPRLGKISADGERLQHWKKLNTVY
jgi:hypothetical protein